MDLLSIVLRSSTRVRLEFSSAVHSSVFTGTGTISITSQDAVGEILPIQQRLVVATTNSAIELVLANDLVEGGLYLLTISGIPAVDTSTASGSQLFRPGTKFTTINSEIETPDIEKTLFGVDLVWTGVDYLQTPDGDLAITAGKANVHNALLRRLTSDGLPWDSNYGVKPRNFVDGPSPSTSFLRGEILRQMLSDDRVKVAGVRLELPEDRVEEANYFVDITLVGSSNTSDFSMEVPSKD